MCVSTIRHRYQSHLNIRSHLPQTLKCSIIMCRVQLSLIVVVYSLIIMAQGGQLSVAMKRKLDNQSAEPSKKQTRSGSDPKADLRAELTGASRGTKSSIASQFNWIMYFLSTTEIVIYFTIYENMMLSRRLKIRLNYFFNDFDRK